MKCHIQTRKKRSGILCYQLTESKSNSNWTQRATWNVIPRELFFAVYLNVEFNVYAPFVQDFADVFNGLGMIATEHEIKLLPGHAPVVCAAARLPFKLQEKVYRKLDQMVEDGVLEPISEPTEWVSRMVVTAKLDGDVRLCIDPSELNKAVWREHFVIPTAEELFA